MVGSLSAELITAGLKTSFIGQRVLYYPSATSTMDIARVEAQKNSPEGTVVVADEQTAGRGRAQRAWLTPKGSSIALSVILYPDVRRLPYLIMVASLAVARSIRAVTGLKPQIKWPNDVLLNGKKVSGILIENGICGNTISYAVIGIGVNVNLNCSGIPEISQIATSLSDETGKPVSRLAIIRNMLTEMEKLYTSLNSQNTVFEEWRDSLITLGKRVKATSADTVYEGIAESVAPDGILSIRTGNGEVVRVVAGDVTLRE